MAGLGVLTALWMFLVLLLGATVTSTGSAQGCGRDWPLCKGALIPDFVSSTAIEFSHRAVTGIAGILVVALAGAALWLWRDRTAIRVLAPLMLAALLLQAGMGAWAVKYPQSAVVLALHFGFSLLALAGAVLTAIFVLQVERGRGLPEVVAPASVRWLTWGAAAYLYALVYTGAYIRHAAAAGACPGWPLCGAGPVANGAGVAVNLVHRLAAAAALLVALGLLLAYRRLAPGRRDLRAGAGIFAGCLLVQGLSGAFLVLSRWGLPGELVHAGVTGVTFCAAAYLCYQVLLGARPAATAAAATALPSPAPWPRSPG